MEEMEAAGRLTTGPWGAPLYCYESLGSTNDEAKRLARAGAPHGTAVTARRQTAGKGRLGRSFYSPADAGMYVSVVLRPQMPAEQSLLITSAAAVAAARAIERVSGVEVKIKWVNDLYFTGKKLCGILSEASLGADGRPEFIIVGIGVNLTRESFPPQLQEITTSILESGGRPVTPQVLLEETVRELLGVCGQLEERSFLSEYRARSCVIGKQVRLVGGGNDRMVYALGIDDNAHLVVQSPKGECFTVGSGEISIKGDWR